MSGLNLEKLKVVQETLVKRGSGASKNWIALSKIEEPIDVRILDPLPNMDGIYFLEVPTWWVNGVKLISPRMLDNAKVKDKDVIDEILAQAKNDAKTDKTLAKLINAKDDKTDMPKIQFKWDYWVPVLQFVWETDKRSSELLGIYNKDGSYDVELIRKFIVDDRVKFLQANITSLKAINTLLTSRGGANMLDAVKGKNIQLQKTGKGRDTKYAVVPTEEMPMPADFYTLEKMPDPYEVAQALMMDDEYMAAVIEKYLYGDVEVPNKDDHYLFPEIREKLKERNKDDEETEESKPSRRRGTQSPAPEAKQADPPPTGRRQLAGSSPAHDDLGIAQPPDQPVTGTRRSPGRPAGGRRNLAQDLIETK